MKNPPLNTIKKFVADYAASEAGQNRIAQLQKQLEHLAGPKVAPRYVLPCDSEIVFGVVACSHYGSLYSNVAGMHSFYKEAKAQGATMVLHAGDVCDGHKMYKGQEFEQSEIGWEAQVKFFEENAPGVLPTHFITGNHDESLKKLAGIAPGPDLARRRPDWNCIGSCAGRITLDAGHGRKCKVDLAHPSGGTSYALSYKSQRLVDALEGGTKPDMLFIGHFHKAEWLPTYRNINVAQTGCMQFQTPFMRDIPTPAHVGGWIVRVRMGENCNSFSGTFVAYYR